MRIKAISSILVFISLVTTGFSQIYQPVKWKFSVEVFDDNTAEIKAEATIDATWHVYALVISDKPDVIGPIPTSVKLDPSKNYVTSGKPTEGKFITHFDPNFEMDLNYFENYAVFKQKIKITADKPFKVTGQLEYMACNDERCIFPDPEIFELNVTPKGAVPAGVVPNEGSVTPAPGEQNSGKKSPLSWNYSSSKISETEFDIIAKTTIESGFHIYSAVSISDGPMPTELINIDLTKFELIGKIQESPKATKHYDENFGTDVYTFEGEATFTQRVRLKDPSNTALTAQIKGMYCSDVCTPFFNDFKVDLTTGMGQEYDPLAGVPSDVLANDPYIMPGVDLVNPLSNCELEKENETILWAFLQGLFWGILALLMPCIFPMIPLTVSFFTKGAEKEGGKKKAVFYGLFIFLIYVSVSVPFHVLSSVDPEMFNEFATNTWVNVIFFIVFVVFAISFFGFYELTLPSSMSNKIDSKSNVGGYIGIFFMALTLVIVSFSCTGPILGSMLGQIYSETSQGTVGFLGMQLSLAPTKLSAATAGFGLALGAPFGFFAFFPSMVKKLPKSGGWMDDFKVSLGFLELVLALKFLSNADLVNQWRFLQRETFFVIWIVLFVLWILYLLGVYRFKKGQGSNKMSKFKVGFIVLLSIIAIRLVPGVLPKNDYNRFAFLSGFPPPAFYSWYKAEHEFHVYTNLDEAIAEAKLQGKPLFLDFTGWACVNCRKMEENVWPEDSIKKILQGKYIMCSLYVDEKVELPADQKHIYTTKDGRKKRIENYGNKWATLQTETFNNNSQPFYALLTPDGELLAPTAQYEPDLDKYENWLRCGLSSFDQQGSKNSASSAELQNP